MDEEKTTTTGAPEGGPFTSSAEAWKSVGAQFQALGQSIAGAFRSTWEAEKTQQYWREVQSGLENVAGAMGKAMDEAVKSPEAERIRQEAQKAAESARQAGGKAVEDARPQVIAALQTVSEELQKLIERLNRQSDAENVAEPPSAAE